MRPEIILHVGTEKTGSTSIQALLGSSYDALIKSGVLFPRSLGAPCHINLTACALEHDPQSPIRRLLGLQGQDTFVDYLQATKYKLREEIEATNPSTIIISDEHINAHLSSVEKLMAYKSLCDEFGEVRRVIIYLRKQDELRLSLFSEAVKSGNLSHFDINNPLANFDVVPYRFRYSTILDNLEQTFGADRITPRVYDRSLLLDGDVVADFKDIAGLRPDLGKVSASEENRSIDAVVIRHLGEISVRLKEMDHDWSEKLRHMIVEQCGRLFSGPGPAMAKSLHRKFLAQFDDDNRNIKRKYFDDVPGRELFPEAGGIEDSSTGAYPECTLSWPEFFIRYVAGTLLGRAAGAIPAVSEQDSQQEQTAPDGQVSALPTETGKVQAECPVCGALYMLDVTVNSREGKLCPACGASGRAQAIAFHVASIICGKPIPLKRHAVDRSKRIVGLSDGSVYADILKKKYHYTNTFFHREPFLDVTNPSEKYLSTLDLLISTEVFEHVIGPSIAAFEGAFEVLKPGGHFILTVPFINRGESLEHYDSDLIGYTSRKNREGKWVAELEFSDGRRETDSEPRFHGGPGKTLEIRLFNRSRLIEELQQAGFTDIVIQDENRPEHGINWGEASRVITARKPCSGKR